jgi:hypothetical protein
MTTNTATTKPPNVLVYTGTGDAERKNFERIKDELLNVLNRDSYVIYQVDDQQVLEHPWSKNSVLLLIDYNQTIEKPIIREFKQYLDDGGNILGLSCGNNQNMSGLLQGIVAKPFGLNSSEDCPVEIRTDRLDFQKDQIDVSCEPFFFEGIRRV